MGMNEHGGGELHPFEIAFLCFAGAAVVIGGLAWATGSLAGLVFSGGWPHLGLTDSLAAVVSFPDHLGDPRGAWPAGARDRLPRAVAMYVSAAAVVGAVAAVTFIVVRRWARRDRGPAVARWASNHELRSLLALHPQPARVTLGRRGRYLVCCEPLHSTLVIAPTQTGKTTGLAIPAIL
jgi:type IV secretion system protein VirD4